jgi:hypothetical protein
MSRITYIVTWPLLFAVGLGALVIATWHIRRASVAYARPPSLDDVPRPRPRNGRC